MKSINDTPSNQSIYIWNIVGSAANALLSIVILMVVTHTLDNKQTDIFSIAWSIGQLMATIGTFQIRTYQATDVEEKYKFQQYLIFRICTILVMLVSSIIYIFAHQYNLYKASVVVIICLFRAVDSLGDVYEGWFQQKERLDLAGKALTYRIVVAMICFGITLAITKKLLLSCIVLLLCYVVCFYLYDIRYTQNVEILKNREKWKHNNNWFVRLALEGFPLFVNAFLMMLITNEPKMIIDVSIEQGIMKSGEQTVFNILFMPASVLTLAYIVFRPLLTKMAIMWNSRDVKGVLKIIGVIMGLLLCVAIVVLVGGSFLGIPALSIIYGVNLDAYKTELLIIIVGGCFCTFSYVFDNALVVIRKQHWLICSYIVTWVYVKIIAKLLVIQSGIKGAAFSYATAMIIFFVSTAVLFVVCLRKAYGELNIGREVNK